MVIKIVKFREQLEKDKNRERFLYKVLRKLHKLLGNVKKCNNFNHVLANLYNLSKRILRYMKTMIIQMQAQINNANLI